MKKLKNKFIIGVILLIIGIIFSQVFNAYSSSSIDTNSYLSLIKGKATINNTFLLAGDQEILTPGDTVRTIGKESLALIEWGDGSITRLGGNTKISVGNNEVSRDYTKIDISFDLIAGKTWSSIVSFISSDSSFTQTFAGVEAGVRGTVFDVDLEKLFVNVTSHHISLQDDSGKEIIVSENKPISLEDFSVIDVSDFLKNFQDIEWKEFNLEGDSDQLGNLKNEIEKHLSNNNPFSSLLEILSPKHKFLGDLIRGASYGDLKQQLPDLNDAQAESLYTTILSRYQRLNFVKPEDTENYDKKILYKRLLIDFSNNVDTRRLVETSLYDFRDAISSQNIEAFNSTMTLLNENKQVLDSIDIEMFLGDINLIPDELERILIENFQGIQGFFEGGAIDTSEVDFSSVTDTVNDGVANIGENLSDAERKARESLEKGLENVFEGLVN